MIGAFVVAVAMVGSSQTVAQIRNEPLATPPSRAEVVETPLANPQQTELLVRCSDDRGPIAFFAAVVDSSGQNLDPTGRGLYRGGRFASDGSFATPAKPGNVEVSIQAGPNHVPLKTEATLKPGKRTELKVVLTRWFSPETRGWYGGDNHVH
ncbi:MAG TPA: hypothetical protein VGE01_02320, partial [Fimbriimonas sp.]